MKISIAALRKELQIGTKIIVEYIGRNKQYAKRNMVEKTIGTSDD